MADLRPPIPETPDAQARLERILFVLENLPDIIKIERKIDQIAEDVAKLRENLVPHLVSGEDYKQEQMGVEHLKPQEAGFDPRSTTGRKPDQTPWDAKKREAQENAQDEAPKKPQRYA